jgi:mannose-6-phosphate isomerase-like protein (cupin superfamily)
VLEGEHQFLLGDRTVRATPGSVVYVPKENLHTFKNVGTTPGRMLILATPVGLHEKFLEEGGEPATDNPPCRSPKAHRTPRESWR